MTRSLALRLACFVSTLCLAGCGSSPLVQVDTAIRPDGSCLRSIWQPKGRFLPADAFSPAWIGRWAVVEDATTPPVFAAQGVDSADHAYFHAQGAFESPDRIPDHFRKPIQDRPDLGAGELTRTYERVDYGPFVEHRWGETLTNNVTRESFEQARDAFLDLAWPMLLQGVERVYGASFDVSAAVEELDRRGRPFARDLIDAWYDAAAVEGPKESSDRLLAGFIAAVERVGVDLHDAAGAVVDSVEGTKRVQAFLADRIAATFRRKGGGGGPPRDEEIEAILSSTSDAAYSSAWSAFAESRKAEFDAKLVPLLIKMTGYYGYPPMFQPPGLRFAFEVRLPGEIVTAETNGTIAEAGRVTWQFDTGRLFPGGYTMTARSLDVDQADQRKRLGKVVVPDAKTAAAVRHLIAEDRPLAEALRRAWNEGDLELLRETPEMNGEGKMRLARLRELLRTAP